MGVGDGVGIGVGEGCGAGEGIGIELENSAIKRSPSNEPQPVALSRPVTAG